MRHLPPEPCIYSLAAQAKRRGAQNVKIEVLQESHAGADAVLCAGKRHITAFGMDGWLDATAERVC